MALYTVACSCWVWTALAAAPEGKGTPPPLNLSLEESIGLALRNNRELVNARLGRQMELFALRAAENEFRPRVTVGPYLERAHTDPASNVNMAGLSSTMALRVPTGGEFQVEWSGAGGNGPSSTRYSSRLGLTFTQPLLRGAGVDVSTASVRTARIVNRIEVLALRQTVIDVVSSVAERYRAYIRAERQADIQADSLERARGLLAVNEHLVRTGRMAARDIVRSKADIATRQNQLLAARNRLDAARLALTDILDIDSRTRIGLTDALSGPPVDPVRTDVALSVKTALRHRPDYQRALLGIRNAETRVAVAESGRLWDLSARFSVNFAQQDRTPERAVSRLSNTDASARLELSVPLSPAATDPQEKAHANATIALRKARNDLANLRQLIDIEVSNAIREVELSRRQVDLARSARALVEETAEIEKEKLRLGLSSNFRLVSLEDDLVAAQTSELDATIAHLNALTALDRTLGLTLDRWRINIDAPNLADRQ